MNTRPIHTFVRTSFALLFVAVLISLATSCTAPQPTGQPMASARQTSNPSADGQKLKAVATTTIVADVVKNVGGDFIELTTLMNPGVDPHSYVATPSDIAALHDAVVIFANGAGLEADLVDILSSAGGNAEMVNLSSGLDLLVSVDAEHSVDPAGAEHQGDEDSDPHVWFDAHNVLVWTDTIAGTLGRLDPVNVPAYEDNARKFSSELEALDAWIIEQIAAIPPGNRILVTNHPSFAYFAQRYGLEQLGAVYPLSPSAEPSARDLALLTDIIDMHDVPALFTETTVDAKLAQQIAHDAGINLVPLYTGSIGEPGSGVESYIQLMRYNVSAMRTALE